MQARVVSALIVVCAACSYGCIQRATLLPVLLPALLPAMVAGGAAAEEAPPPPPPVEPAPPDSRRFIVHSADSKLEVTAGDLSTGMHVLKFDRWRGVLLADSGSPPERPSGRLTLDVDLTTLTTDGGVESFLKHELLEVNRHPRARIVATIRPRDDDPEGHVVQGRISLHGVERMIRFYSRLRKEGQNYRLDTTFDMSRKDFGIKRHDALDFLIYNDFRVVFGFLAHAENVSAEVLSPEEE